MAIESALAFTDVTRYRRAIPGPLSPYVALETLFYAILLVSAGYMVTFATGQDTIIFLLLAFLMVLICIIGLNGDYRLMKRAIRAYIRPGSARYDDILVSFYDRMSIETMVNVGCDYLSKNGVLHLLCVTVIPSQLPFEYGSTQKAKAGRLLGIGTRIARRRNVNFEAGCAFARDPGDAVLEMSGRCGAGLVVMGAGKATPAKKQQPGSAVDHVIKKSRCDVIVIFY